MNQMAFWHAVHDEPGLTWLGVTETAAVVRGPLHAFEVTPFAIADETWEDLRDVLLERRPVLALTQMARVVGYFSNVKNWNRSKVAEQVDRRKGEYLVTGEMPPVPVPKFIQEALASGGAELACLLTNNAQRS